MTQTINNFSAGFQQDLRAAYGRMGIIEVGLFLEKVEANPGAILKQGRFCEQGSEVLAAFADDKYIGSCRLTSLASQAHGQFRNRITALNRPSIS